MSSFRKCLGVEAEGKKLLLPWVREWFGCEPVEIPKTYDDQTRGDWIITDKNRTPKNPYKFNAELKSEEKWTGNLFLEVVSNANMAPPRPGWLWTSRADELWYVFLDKRKFYRMHLGLLREWLIPRPEAEDNPIDSMRLTNQDKNVQENLTQGYPVSVDRLAKEVRSFQVITL